MENQPNSCFFDNYFDTGLKTRQANMDIKPIFNEYKTIYVNIYVKHICQYLSKTEDQSMKQAAKEVFENDMLWEYC